MLERTLHRRRTEVVLRPDGSRSCHRTAANTSEVRQDGRHRPRLAVPNVLHEVIADGAERDPRLAETLPPRPRP
jgi:hypothetical protein